MPECRGFVQKGLTHWVGIPKCSVTGMLARWGHGSKQKKKNPTNPSGQMCPSQCKSQVPLIQAGFPVHNPTKPGTYLVFQYYIRTAHAWLYNPFLKTSWQLCRGHDVFLCEGGRQDSLKSCGVLDWVCSAGCFGVCVWQPAWGQPYCFSSPLPR